MSLKCYDQYFLFHGMVIIPPYIFHYFPAKQPPGVLAFIKISDTIYSLSWTMDKCSSPEVFAAKTNFNYFFIVTGLLEDFETLWACGVQREIFKI